MHKPRILFLISFNFQIRYLIRTGFINQIRAFCEPVICFNWKQQDLCDELDALGIEWYIENRIVLSEEVKETRTRIDDYYRLKISRNVFYKNLRRLNRHRYSWKRRIKYELKLIRDKLFFTRLQYEKFILTERQLVENEPWFSAFILKLQSTKIEGIFTLSPYLFFEESICRIANKIDIPVYYSVLSFDNLSNRGYFTFKAKKYFVWNDINKAELIKLIEEKDAVNKIEVVGVPQFDFYYKKDAFVENINEWKTKKAIEPNRRVLLYGANSKNFITNEKKIIKEIDNAICSGIIINNPVIIVRPHPTDSFIDWEEFIAGCKNVIIEKSLLENESLNKITNKYSNFLEQDIIRLCSSLANSDVHISIASTMALDGAAFNKPIVCPYFAPSEQNFENKIVREFYWSDHYKHITLSGAISLPKNYKQLFMAINESLKNPDKLKLERQAMMQKMTFKTDGNATMRLVEKFKACLN